MQDGSVRGEQDALLGVQEIGRPVDRVFTQEVDEPSP
jgi:hypothetical protein